ncbi:MAG: hypothetical protein JWM33_3375 [Caulobacteraceae bacterium]|nr:hypothetical protein [Caulobacteraceae bacterium]
MAKTFRVQLKSACALACVLAVVSPSLAVAATPSELLYERTLMSTAGSRCNLFTPPLASALAASAAQARGAALRAGQRDDDLSAVIQRARAKAASTPCSSGDILKAAANVRDAFAAFAGQNRQAYPGDLSGWTADRGSFAWLLSEPAAMGADKATIGLPASGGGLTVTATFADGRVPYAARLVLRDPSRTQGAYLDRSKASGGDKLPYIARLAPASVTRSFLASSREIAPANLLPTGIGSGWRFGFPNAAVQALAALDPREAVSVEFLFSAGGADSKRTAYVEVGDFAAALAFAAMG